MTNWIEGAIERAAKREYKEPTWDEIIAVPETTDEDEAILLFNGLVNGGRHVRRG